MQVGAYGAASLLASSPVQVFWWCTIAYLQWLKAHVEELEAGRGATREVGGHVRQAQSVVLEADSQGLASCHG